MTEIHVHAPAPTALHVQVLRRHCRKWRDVRYARGPRTVATARREAARMLADQSWVRAVRVVASYEWYDPSVVFEAHKR